MVIPRAIRSKDTPRDSICSRSTPYFTTGPRCINANKDEYRIKSISFGDLLSSPLYAPTINEIILKVRKPRPIVLMRIGGRPLLPVRITSSSKAETFAAIPIARYAARALLPVFMMRCAQKDAQPHFMCILWVDTAGDTSLMMSGCWKN